MGFFRADFSDLDRLGNRFKIARIEVANVGYKVADDIGQRAADAIREEAPEGRTGKLKRNIEHNVRVIARLGGGYAVTVVSPTRHTGWVIEGRGWVRPVRAQVLHWKNEAGDDVFSMRAKPTKPNPFHERGWQRAVPGIRQRWEEYAERNGVALAD